MSIENPHFSSSETSPELQATLREAIKNQFLHVAEFSMRTADLPPQERDTQLLTGLQAMSEQNPAPADTRFTMLLHAMGAGASRSPEVMRVQGDAVFEHMSRLREAMNPSSDAYAMTTQVMSRMMGLHQGRLEEAYSGQQTDVTKAETLSQVSWLTQSLARGGVPAGTEPILMAATLYAAEAAPPEAGAASVVMHNYEVMSQQVFA